MTKHVRLHVIGRSPASGHTPAPTSPCISLTGCSLPASGHFECQRPVEDRRCMLSATTDRTQDPSVRSPRDQRPVHSVRPCLFCVGHRWHHRTIRTLRADTPPMEFLHQVDPHQLQLHLLCKCANTTKCTPPCVCVLAFHNHFQRMLATQLATPLNPSDDAKLDHSSGTR